MSDLGAIVAHNLVRLRAKHGLTQQQLAKKSSLSRSTVAAIEGRRYASTDTESIESLARALDEPIAEFFRPVPARRRKAS